MLGKEDAAIDILSRVVGNADRGWLTSSLVTLLVRCGEFDEALRLVDTIDARSVSARSAKAYLFAGVPQKRKMAEQLCNSLLDEDEPIDAGSCAIEILCILGDRDRVKSESRRCLELMPEHTLPNWMPEKSLAFHAGRTIDEFYKDCGESAIGRMVFHYHVAMRKISEGDRPAAIQYLDRCAESSLIDGGYYHWARAFQILLEKNPEWADNSRQDSNLRSSAPESE